MQIAFPDCIFVIREEYILGHHEPSILVNKVVDIPGRRNKYSDLAEAKKKDQEGLMERNMWKSIKKTSLPPGANILNGRFILSFHEKDS